MLNIYYDKVICLQNQCKEVKRLHNIGYYNHFQYITAMKIIHHNHVLLVNEALQQDLALAVDFFCYFQQVKVFDCDFYVIESRL